MGIVEQFLLQFNNEKRRFKRVAAILTALSFCVVISVAWNLRITAITIANDATCSLQEHQHTEQCTVEKVLSCDIKEDIAGVQPIAEEVDPIQQEAEIAESSVEEAIEEAVEKTTEETAEKTTEETAEETTEETAEETTEEIAEETVETTVIHTHTEECYSDVYSCGMEEHIHNISCYADTTADTETATVWESTLPQLTENWAEDIVLVAQSQIGNSESERNYIVAQDGETRNGITRYGQWYGNPYGDWSSMFVLFCLDYAEIPQLAVPHSPGVDNMMRMAEEALIVSQPDSNMEKAGNLLFVDTDGNGNADKIFISTQYAEGEITAIGGDIENSVAEITISATDPTILGYIDLAELQIAFDENNKQTEEEQNDNLITLTGEFTEEDKILLTAQFNSEDAEMYLWQWQYSEDGNEPWTDIEGAMDFVLELENTEENCMRYYRLQGYKMQMMPMTFSLRQEQTTESEELTGTEFATQARAIAETEIEEETEDEDYGVITSEAITPFSINKSGNNYTINVYALPIDANGNRITGIEVKKLTDITVNKDVTSTKKKEVETSFDTGLGTYVSAFFGNVTNNNISIDSNADNIKYVWRYKSGNTYYLAYQKTDGTTNETYKSRTDSSISLYLRYIPDYTVTFQSSGFSSVSVKVQYNGSVTLEDQPSWTKDGQVLVGWVASDDPSNVYTYEALLTRPVTQNVTYTAQWASNVKISFNQGEYMNDLESIEPMIITYGSSIEQLPVPVWKNNVVASAFDGWYLDVGCTQEVTTDYVFREDTILYAKWGSKDDGYYVYFMDFEREGYTPLVLVTYSITEGHTASAYTPGNAPEGTAWDGKWYLDNECRNEYNFRIPVSQMTDYLTGENQRDLYLYPGTKDVCRAIFVTYGTKIDPITVGVGDTIDLSKLTPTREGYEFAGWILSDGTPVTGEYKLNETTTFYAKWNSGYVPFEAILRIENANDTGMTQADILGTWYAKAGSQIKVKSTYTGTGNSRKGTHTVVCILDGVEYPVYTNSSLSKTATLNDVYATYFLYNNTGTAWTDEVNWDDIYTGGELPYSTRPISSAGDTIINFDYMRVRNDIVFSIPNSSSGGYIDIYKLQQNGLITGSVIYTGTVPTSTGQNVSATGVSATNIRWSYNATTQNDAPNQYILHDMKYGQRIFEVYPVGGSWLTARNQAYHQYEVSSGKLFSSRRQDLTSDFFSGSGRGLTSYTLTAEFENQEYIALMYAVECLEGETPDFIYKDVGYKVDVELCEVVKHTGGFGIKDLEGCAAGASVLGQSGSDNKYYTSNAISGNNTPAVKSSTVVGDANKGNPTAETLFGTTYWSYYSKFNGVSNLKTFAKMYIFYYDRLHMNIQFNFGYDTNGDGTVETVKYENIAYGEKIDEYQFGKADYQQHSLLEREGYEFVGWYDANGFVLEAEDWDSMIATGDSNSNTMIFIAKWEKISNNIVEYYEDRSASEPFETHYFDDGELMQYPAMTVYPDGWVWQEYGEGLYQRFDWDVPMYGEYGVQETRTINGEQRVVNVIRIYGTWDESHTKVVYTPNEPQGGIPGTAPSDYNEYTIWQSAVPVASQGNTANADPDMIFTGWQLDRNGVVYQPGDHVPVQWPRTMIFTAQWAKAEEVVYLRYDPNGGTPENRYPSDMGFAYKKNSNAFVWENISTSGSPYYTRSGYSFIGWNTQPDGTGTAYQPGSEIILTEPLTTLYAQWKSENYTLSLRKIDNEKGDPLAGAQFGLYKLQDGEYLSVQRLTTGVDGHISFTDLEVDRLYKLIEEKPPEGYAIIVKEIYFKVQPEGTTRSIVFYDSEGNIITLPNAVVGEYISSGNYLMLTVKNLYGYTLPSTGGTGTLIYMLCGLALVLAPLVYGFSLRRKYERRLNK